MSTVRSGVEIVDILIRAGADPEAGSDDTRVGETPLHWAASSDDVDVADVLIAGGCQRRRPRRVDRHTLENAVAKTGRNQRDSVR